MNYSQELKRAMDEAPVAAGMTKNELGEKIAAITDELITRPMNNAERIMLCADRASLRKALAALG